MMIQIAVNGNRQEKFIPKKKEEIVQSTVSAIEKGAETIHFHPRDADGKETLNAAVVDEHILELKRHQRQVPVGISTGEWIEPNLERRLAHIKSWRVLPDFVSINYEETGSDKVTEVVNEKGILIEAGLSNLEAAKNFIKIYNQDRFIRILIEPQEQVLEGALHTAALIENQIEEAGIQLPILLHGVDKTCWNLLKLALVKGYQTRIGLEDVLTLPNGKKAKDNAELLKEALLIKASI